MLLGSLRPAKSVLVVGMGGGGDVVSSIPVRNYLMRRGFRVVMGAPTWERHVIDPEPGARRLDEILNIEPLSKTSALASRDTVSRSGVRFTASAVSEFLNERILLLDPNFGVRGLIEGMTSAMEKLGLDAVVGVDGGGDVLASGSEKSVRSILLDSMMLAAITSLDSPGVLAVIGCCADGELTLDEFLVQLAKVAQAGGILGIETMTPEDAAMMENVVPKTSSEVSRLILAAYRGEFGRFRIRGETRVAEVTPLTPLIFFIDPAVVRERVNPVAGKLVDTRSLEEANEIVRMSGLPTELDFEKSIAGERA